MADEQSSAKNSIGQAAIPLVNKLQDIFAQLGGASTIDLPQVAVVGSQSSGKSSVLEALVGRDFLPRGPDICTRRPLVLQLVQSPKGVEAGGDEWGEFLHLPGMKFFDFAAIRSEIQAETERGAGGHKGVSDKQIRLKVFSPNVLNITLVDLPGITKVPVGDQPKDIEGLIRTMIHSYIKHETCIILAVTPANSDLANSDALQVARVADPDGRRTIGVITKLDIMDRGTDAQKFLLGKVIPLQLGYVGVVNRSQEDIICNRSIKEALAYEEEFFPSKPVYHGLSEQCGIPQLAKKLNQILVQHIMAVYPGLKARINAQLVAVAKEIASYGEITESKEGQGALLLNLLTKYCEAFSSMVEGKNDKMSTSELSGGARIHYIFQSIFVKSLEGVDPCENITDEDICIAIQNATGLKSSLFVPLVPFELLVRRQIERLADPSIQCGRFIYDELIKMSHCCLSTQLQRFPVLRKRMDEVVGNFLRECLKPAETMILNIIGMEMDYINTAHPNFIGGSKAVELAHEQIKSRLPTSLVKPKEGLDHEKVAASEKTVKSRALFPKSLANGFITDQGVRPPAETERLGSSGANFGSSWGFSSIFSGSDNRQLAKESSTSKMHSEVIYSMEQSFSSIQLNEPPAILRPSENHTEQELVEILVTKLLLKSYYDIVRKNIEDSVPKAIMLFLVNHAKRELLNVFIGKLYITDLFEEMLQEPDETTIKRKRLRETYQVLLQAFDTLDEIPLEAATVAKGYSIVSETTGSSRLNGLPSPSLYTTSDEYSMSLRNSRYPKMSRSGEQPSPFHSDSYGNRPHLGLGS
ncbi:hypothetical protein H6P81_003406 [Aristolochia fimbriata]|uniref:Dynamin-related protein 3A-like n=1 Tax=Aristolochia fimbriata TaxID=158543 RepID=A0AAV7FGT7_ARIFI|nr:hypothetical protein H6P81_003406 [Aristolochia fimbriata]